MVPLHGREKVKSSSSQINFKLIRSVIAVMVIVPMVTIHSVIIQADEAPGKVTLNDFGPEKLVQPKSVSQKQTRTILKKSVSNKETNPTGQLWNQNSIAQPPTKNATGHGFQTIQKARKKSSDSDEFVEQLLQIMDSREKPSLKFVPKHSATRLEDIFNKQQLLDLVNFQKIDSSKLPPLDEEAPPKEKQAPNSTQNQTNQNSNSSSGNADTEYGTAPEDRSFDFLRTVSPLLKRGEFQVDIGFAYSMYENDTPVIFDGIPDPDFVTEGRLRLRQMTVPLAIRYGLSERVQLFLDAPVGWSNAEFSFPGFEIHDDVSGIGDITGGATVLLSERDGCHPNEPDLIGTVAVTAPTGNDSFASIIQLPSAQLGSGHWGISANLLSIRTIDPLVIFHGGGIRYQFAEDRGPNNSRVEPGLEFNYQFGVGFSINEKVTMSTILLGSYITELELAGQTLDNSSLEPVRVRFALTMARPKDRILEPFLEFGLTDDSSSFNLGWTLTFK